MINQLLNRVYIENINSDRLTDFTQDIGIDFKTVGKLSKSSTFLIFP